MKKIVLYDIYKRRIMDWQLYNNLTNSISTLFIQNKQILILDYGGRHLNFPNCFQY